MVMSAQSACGANAILSQCQVRQDGLVGWLEHAPEAQGRQVFCYYLDHKVHRLLDSGVSIRSRVNEYGARAWSFAKEGIVFVEESSQKIYFWRWLDNEPPILLGGEHGARYSEPCYVDRGHVVAIEEWQGVHRIVCFTIDGSRQVLREGEDFYAGLAVSHEGMLAWVSWQHPQQPWTVTSLWQGMMHDHLLGEVHCIVSHDSSIQMPVFDASGKLLYLDDVEGFWQLYSYAEGVTNSVLAPGVDMANAPWQSGWQLYGIDAAEQLWSTRFDGSGVTLWCNEELCQPDAARQIKELAVVGSRVVAIHAGPDCMGEISDYYNGRWHSIWRVPLPLDVEQPSQPEVLAFESEGQTVYGYWYAPSHTSSALPVLINLHGGPTSSSYPVFNPMFQFWNDHGFAVLDLNYRGSSNRGRDFRLQLQHDWGQMEVDDVRCAVQQLIEQGRADPDKVFIRGRSSGGYSVLMALLNYQGFKAAAVYFGVSDPLRLHANTHKFESHYLPWLLGDMDETKTSYLQRVPTLRALDIHTPIVFFQGLADKVVTPEQTASMVEAIKGSGGKAEYHYFSDEGHGFRRPQNNIAALNAELAFYRAAMAD